MLPHKSLWLFFISAVAFSQNLVKNPSFEAFKKCPPGIGFFDRSIKDWSTPNNGTTDYFNICNDNLGFKNYNGNQQSKSGNAYAGIYVFSSYTNYREYIQGELTSKLKKGEVYKFTFFISLAEYATHAIKDIQVLFSEEKIKKCYHKNWCEKVLKPQKMTKKRFQIHKNTATTYYNQRDQWMEVSFEFTAEGFEQFFTIGNFNNDSKTKRSEVLAISKNTHTFSYYYIDDVSVISTALVSSQEKDSIVPKAEEVKRFEIDTTYKFSNVLFEFDKAELKQNTIKELDELFTYLAARPSLNIEVYGHTDDVGITKRNKELSIQRARAVAEYLILQGLKPKRIQWFGFGSENPIATNNTEEGRQQNRRVEFRLKDN